MNAEKNSEQITAVPLFDNLPQNLLRHESSIWKVFDGSLNIGDKTYGIEMLLDFQNDGRILRALLYDLESGALSTSYEPLDRGRWSNKTKKDLEPGDREYHKLNAVALNVQRQLVVWRGENRNRVMRVWSKQRGKNAVLGMGKATLPQDWYESIALKERAEKTEEELQIELDEDLDQAALLLNADKEPEAPYIDSISPRTWNREAPSFDANNVQQEVTPETHASGSGGQTDPRNLGELFLKDHEAFTQWEKEHPPERGRKTKSV